MIFEKHNVRSGDDLRWLFVFWSREFVSGVFAAGFDWLERIYRTDYPQMMDKILYQWRLMT